VKRGQMTQKDQRPPSGDGNGYHLDEDDHLDILLFPNVGECSRQGTARQVIEQANALESLSLFLQTPFQTPITRNLVRAVIAEEVLRSPSPQLERLLSYDLEAMIALKETGNAAFSDCYLLTVARNAPERRPSPEDLPQQVARASSLFLEARKHPLAWAKRVQISSSYCWFQLTQESERSLIDSYRELLAVSFGPYGEAEELDAVLSEEEAVVLVAVPTCDFAKVVGGVYARPDPLLLRRNGKEIVLVAYRGDGGAVHAPYQGQGLYTVLFQMLWSRLASKHDPLIDVAFGFVDIGRPAALKAAAKTGNILVTETAAPFHFALLSTPQIVRKGNYVDELVAYLPGKTLREIYGNGQENEEG
jgi:hypothetical protein